MDRKELRRVTGERLRIIRNHYGYTQKDFAEKIGVPWASYKTYELGIHSPHLDVLGRIEKLTGFSADYITGKSDYFGDDSPIKNDVYFATYTEIKIVKYIRATKQLGFS